MSFRQPIVKRESTGSSPAEEAAARQHRHTCFSWLSWRTLWASCSHMKWACRPGLLALVGPQLGPQLAPSCNRKSRERVGLQQPLPVEALAAGAEMQWPLQLVKRWGWQGPAVDRQH